MPELIAGKYEVIETIGRGGMGTVYKARQTNLDRIVAIKMLSEELASDPEFRARFQQEATVVARLNHPNIVQVHDIEPHNKTFCIIMEFVDGENLQAKIDRDVTVSESEVLAIGAQVGRALAYAHTRGIIHRDIKPDNIHVTPKGVAKVMDFGIARLVDSKLKTQTGISMGTPKFMSPEQVTGKNVDGQTDLYSLGICLYYCVAGRVPFDGENAISVATRHLYEQPEPPSHLNPSISPAVEKVILKALEKKKENRYLTGTEMADALDGVLGRSSAGRVGGEGEESLSGATRKMPSQSYGGVVPTPAAGPSSTGRVPVSSPRDAQMTPVSHRTVPELEDDFRTPDGNDSAKDPTRSFRVSLFIFGGLVIGAVVLLILLVMWLRRSDSGITDIGQSATRIISPVERIEKIDAEADSMLSRGQATEARDLWLKFQKQYPQIEPDRISAEIRAIEARLPVTETRVLAERRYQEAFTHLNNQNRALAYAYLKAAVALSPELATSAITTNTLQNLERKLAVAPSSEGEESAQQALAMARQRISDNELDTETQNLLIQAVETNYAGSTNWEALGDFFLQTQNVDGARVMYAEAAGRTVDPTTKARLTDKLRKVSR